MRTAASLGNVIGLFVLLALGLEWQPLAAAPETLVPDTGPGTMFNIAIVNQTNHSVKIAVRPKGGAWASHDVAAGEKPIYSCQGCNGRFEVSIQTAGTTVTYDLNSGTLYAIRVNSQRDIFDVYSVP